MKAIKHLAVTAVLFAIGTFCAQASYSGKPVIPSKINAYNYIYYDLLEEDYRDYLDWYGIRTAEELYGFAVLVNEMGVSLAQGVLCADIEVNRDVLTPDGELNGGFYYRWTPIGTRQNLFGGLFDGQGHTISGLFFDDTSNVDYPSGGQNVGLFGFVEGRGSL